MIAIAKSTPGAPDRVTNSVVLFLELKKHVEGASWPMTKRRLVRNTLLSFLGKLGAVLVWLLSGYEALLLSVQEVSLLETKPSI